MPTAVEEEPGAGVRGLVEARRISIGSHAYVAARAAPADWTERFLRRMGYEGGTGAFVAADGRFLGAILLADEIRPDSARALRHLREAGIARVVMLTGDRRDVAEAIGATLGVDEVRAQLQAQDKLAAIAAARQTQRSGLCAMVGDGVNDAPALLPLTWVWRRARAAPGPLRRPRTLSCSSTGSIASRRPVADELSAPSPREAAASLSEVEAIVRDPLLQHEWEDEAKLYPVIERALGGNDPIPAMHRTHREVQQLGGVLHRMVADLPPEGADQAAINDFRRVLYGLEAILRLHFAQEDELYYGLADTERGDGKQRVAVDSVPIGTSSHSA